MEKKWRYLRYEVDVTVIWWGGEETRSMSVVRDSEVMM